MTTRLVRGNSATVIGALYAGCDCFFGYPITPASEICHEAATYFPKLGRVFIQAESELAAINMVYGAAAAGHRAMTGSSGPGISLMMEGISYMAGAELPGVLVDIMRAGPGLGNIGPEQGDYNQMVKGGGHGNYRTIVLAPASVQEMCDLTYQAFDLAFAYRTPVVILADAVLGQMMEPLTFPEEAVQPEVPAAWAVAATPETRHNVITSIYLDFDELERHNNRLQEKYRRICETEVRAETYLTADAELIVVAYGICSRMAQTAVELARQDRIRAGLLRPISLYPFPAAVLRQLADVTGRGFLVAELSNGQMSEDVRLATECRRPVHTIGRMGGSLLTADEILAMIYELCPRRKVAAVSRRGARKSS